MIDAPVRLRRAIYMEDVALVQRIIKANPKLLQNPDFGDKSNTSLHLAAQLGLTAIASFLLKSGHEAKEISRNVEWETPLMIAAKHGHVEIGRFIIETCQRCIPWTNKDGLDALAIACQHQASTPLIPLLLSNPDFPASPHGQDNNGDTPLHHASAAGSLKALRILLTAGADPMAQNADDWPPLAYSQTVAAEVYFKNLIAEFERRKTDGVQEEKERREEHARRKGAGVRLITDDESTTERPGIKPSTTWSPVEYKATLTPTLGDRGMTWNGSHEGARARARSGT